MTYTKETCRDDTRPSEELNFNSQVNFFTNPERAAQNIFIGVGTVSGKRFCIEQFSDVLNNYI